MKIVTGRKGTPHVTSNDDQARNQAVFGTGSYVFNIGTKFELTVVSANEIWIGDGEGVMQGVHFRIEPNTYDTVTIENGSQSMKRIDLIVARYEKDDTEDTEDVTLQVIRGEAVASNPQAPSYNTGDILQGDLIVDMPLYEVLIDGITLDSTTSRFSVIAGINALNAISPRVTTLEGRVTDLETVEHTTMSFLGSTANLYKCGKIVQLDFFGTPGVALTTATEVTAGTVPAGYRPARRVSNGIITSKSINSRPTQVTINTDGTVVFYTWGDTQDANSGWVRFSFVYIAS